MLCTTVFAETNHEASLPLPVILIGIGSLSNTEATQVRPLSSRPELAAALSNIDFISDLPAHCPAKYTNLVENANLFTPSEKRLLAEIPYLYQRITTNSGPSNSVLVSLEQTRWPLSEYYEVALFRDSNSNAQVKAFFAERSDGERRWISNKKEWISYRTKSGDGYDVSFYDNGLIDGFRQYKRNQLDGLWADFESNHCTELMHFVDGKAVGKWFTWNKDGSLYMEANFRIPYDLIEHLKF